MEESEKMNTRFRDWVREETADYKLKDKLLVADAVGELISDFARIFEGSAGMTLDCGPREKGFQLRDHTVPFKDGVRKEDKAERGIIELYAIKGKRDALPNVANLKSINSYQVPMQPHGAPRSKWSRLGKVDLMGATEEGLPAIIELKVGTGWCRWSGLFHAILEGVAYAMTIRYAWKFLQVEWRKEINADVPDSIESHDTPVIVMADDSFYNQEWELLDDTWPVICKWMTMLAEIHLPVYFARFDDDYNLEIVDHLAMKISGKSIGGAFAQK